MFAEHLGLTGEEGMEWLIIVKLTHNTDIIYITEIMPCPSLVEFNGCPVKLMDKFANFTKGVPL